MLEHIFKKEYVIHVKLVTVISVNHLLQHVQYANLDFIYLIKVLPVYLAQAIVYYAILTHPANFVCKATLAQAQTIVNLASQVANLALVLKLACNVYQTTTIIQAII